MLTVLVKRLVKYARFLRAAVMATCALGLMSACSRASYDNFAEEIDRVFTGRAEDGPTVFMGLDGCWMLEPTADGHTLVCTLDPLLAAASQRVRVIVRDKTDATLSVSCRGCTAVACNTDAGPESVLTTTARCVDLQPGPSPSPMKAVLRLSTQEKSLGERVLLLATTPRTALDDLHQRWRDAAGQGLSALEALIPQAEAAASAKPPGPLRERAQILTALMRYDQLRTLRNTQGQLEDRNIASLIRLLELALQTAHSRRWFRSEADISEALAWLYADLSHGDAVSSIEKLLTDKEWVPLLPAQKIYCDLWLVSAALEQQDLRRVEHYVAGASAEVELLSEVELWPLLLDLRSQEIEKVALSGSRAEVKSRLRELEMATERAAGKPCVEAHLWNIRGWVELLLVELGWPDARDPLPALEQARALRTHQCPDAARLANVWANLARAKSAAWWHRAELTPAQRMVAAQATREALAGLHAALGSRKETDSIRLDRLLSEVRSDLLEGVPARALKHFGDLSRLASSSRSPLDKWLIWVHKAEVLEMSGQPTEAISALRKADEQLLTLQRQVPIYQAHRLVLSRFEYSSQHAVALALRAGRPGEALEILRQAGQLGLGLTTIPWWNEQTEGTKSEAWQRRRQEQARYLEQRGEYEKQISHASMFNPTQCKELGEAKSGWLESLDTLFAGPSPTFFPPPAVPDGELLIGCTRQQGGWVCLGASEGTTEVVALPQPELDGKAVEGILLPALAVKVRRATKLRILAHGTLAQVGLGSLQFDGCSLGTQKKILYSVDRPPAPPAPSSRQALVVINPEGNISGLSIESAQRFLEPALGGMRVTARSATASFAAPASWRPGEALSFEVLGDLQRSGVFIYFGHVDPMPCPLDTPLCADTPSGAQPPDSRLTALCLTQHTALSVSDVLAAVRVPQRVFLLGCESTDRSATTPTEMLGLAQAFAVRGSQVLAVAQRVPAPQAEEVLCALGQQRLADPDFDLGQVLLDMQQRFARGERCKALGRWHTPPRAHAMGTCSAPSDWQALRWYGP